jgi:putative DNA primase/helicase
MMSLDLRTLARALRGGVAAGQVLAPGPGHSPKDRSLSVRLSATAPDGFLAFSHSGDDWREVRDYVRERFGLRYDRQQRPPRPIAPPGDDDRIGAALAVWREAHSPQGTIAELYLSRRTLTLDDGRPQTVLRWHPGFGAMVALFRNVRTDEPQAVSRTFLDYKGRKFARKFLGPVGGAAIKMDPDDEVLGGLHIGEGLETCMAARQLGLRPTWALGSAGAVAAFPVLSGIETLTILAEHDEASARAVQACADRWLAAGRDVIVNEPIGGKDLNDSIRGDRHDG